MKKLFIVLTLVMMVLPAAAWSMSSTLNKDFEDGFQPTGIANGWYAFNGTTPVCAGDSANVHNFAWSQKVVSAGVKAKFDAPAGMYTVSVWVKAPTGVAKVAIMTGVEDSSTLNPSDYLTNTANNTWQQLTKTLVAKTDSIVVFCATYGTGPSYFDEVTVVPVGEHTPPELVWWNQAGGGDSGGNPFLCGGVFDGNVIFGQISNCVKMFGDTVVDPWAPPLHQTPNDIGNDDFTAKCATILNGYIYCTTGYGDIRQSVDWGALGHYIPFNKSSTVPANDPTNVLLRKKLNNDSSALVTDGTYLYAQDDNLGGNAATNTIYKWQMNHAGGGSIVGNVAPFPVTISGCSQLLGICYWNGKIYAAEGLNGGQIFEIDCATGAVTPLLTAPNLLPNTGGNYGQVARYGDKIFVGTAIGHLYTWQLISGTWTLVSGYDLHMDDPPFVTKWVLGLAAKNARSLWVTTGGTLRYYDLPPTSAGSFTDIDFDAGLSEWVNDAVVTAVGPAGTGFWVENQQRTMGAQVAWTGAMPTVGKFVTIKATASKTASGEKLLTAIDGTTAVVEGATADPVVKPLFVTNKGMGLATGGTGLANDGLLVTVCGRITFLDVDNYPYPFYIDDGSAVPSEVVAKGVKVLKADGTFPEGASGIDLLMTDPMPPCYAVVTGIVRLDMVGGTIYRRIDLRSDADLVITAL